MKGWHNDSYRHSLAARHIRSSMARIPQGTLGLSGFVDAARRGSQWGAAPSKTSLEVQNRALRGKTFVEPFNVELTRPEQVEMAKYQISMSQGADALKVKNLTDAALVLKPMLNETMGSFRQEIENLLESIPNQEIGKWENTQQPVFARDYVANELNRMYDYGNKDFKNNYIWTGDKWVRTNLAYDQTVESVSTPPEQPWRTQDMGEIIKPRAEKVWNGIKSGTKNVGSGISSAIKSGTKNVGSGISSAYANVGDKYDKYRDNIKKKFSDKELDLSDIEAKARYNRSHKFQKVINQTSSEDYKDDLLDGLEWTK